MKDRYLFKAKRVDNGEWVQGYYYQIWEKGYILWGMTNDVPNMIEVDVSTLCQCTGLKDKNGKLIWENDVVNCLTEKCCGCIGWNESEAGFYFNVLLEDGRFEKEYIYDYQDGIGVIGNIFNNKELLESEE
jgi:uncharacterized phage protein (TIGR01671 family)|nr:MAG TPA: YopX protein [Caudoviricetes sp.]